MDIALPTGGTMRSAIALALLLASASAYVQEAPPVDLTGVWSPNSLDTLQNPAWDLIGLLSCRCAAESYDYLQELLDDPENDHLSGQDLIRMFEEHTQRVVHDRLSDLGRETAANYDLADDPAIQCERFGAFRTILHSDPIEFEMHDDRIEVRGEDLSVDRTVYMDGLREEARRCSSLGFTGKAAIHPKQIPVLNETFSPAGEEVARAREIIAAFEAGDGGLVVHQGKLIEKPVLRSMQRIVAIADAQ